MLMYNVCMCKAFLQCGCVRELLSHLILKRASRNRYKQMISQENACLSCADSDCLSVQMWHHIGCKHAAFHQCESSCGSLMNLFLKMFHCSEYMGIFRQCEVDCVLSGIQKF